MSETKIGAVFTVEEPISIGGEIIKPGEHVVHVGKVFPPNRTVVWGLPPIENAVDAPTYNMIYGFSFGGITPTEIKTWGWTINGEPHKPRPEYPKPIEGGGKHDVVISVTLLETVELGREFNLTATIRRE